MILLLMVLLATGAYAQAGNGTGQEPTEEKQGGEYSGFDEAQEQSRGIPNQEANPTPQAPITNLDVQQENRTQTAGTTAVEPSSPYGMGLLAGLGAVAAVAIVTATWYFKKSRSK